jgi:hypothetical protein
MIQSCHAFRKMSIKIDLNKVRAKHPNRRNRSTLPQASPLLDLLGHI